MSINLDGILGVSATGNITTDNYFIGNGSQLTGITTGNVDLTAVTTDIIPAGNVTQSLGNATNQWKDLWLSNSTLYLNSLPLSTVEVGNVATIEFNGNPIVVSSNTAPPQTANIATTADVIGGNLVISNATPGGGLVFPDGTVQTTAAGSSNYGDSNVSTYLAGGTDTAGFTTTGNVTASFFIGDGSQITNLPAGNYSNANVAAYLAANTDSTILAIDLALANTNANVANTDSNVANLVTITTSTDSNVANLTTSLANTNANVANTDSNVANLVTITTSTDSNVANLTTALANTNANVANNTANIVTLNATVANLATTSALANTDANVANLTTALGNTNANVIVVENSIANTNSNVANLSVSLANTNANVSNTNSNVSNVQLQIIAGENALSNTNANVANVASNVTTLQGQVYANANVSAYLGNATTVGDIYATNINASNTVTATTFIGNFQGNITGNLVVPGASTWVLYNEAGNAGADIGFRYDPATQDVVVGNTVTANFFIGDGSQLTGLPAAYGNANVEAYLPTSNVILGIDGNVNNVIISLNNTNSNVSNTNANVSTLNNTVANLATSSSLANTNANVANTNANVANLVIITTSTNSNVANLTTDLANTDSNVANLQTQVNAIPVVTRIPTVYLTAVANGNGQVFSNVILSNYTSNADMTAFLNGVLLENTNYTLAGDVLTVDTYLRTGDTIDVTTTLAANVNNVSSGYGNSNVALFFADYAGDIVPATDNAYDLGEPGNVWAAVYANSFVGDGSQLTGLPNSNAITNGTSNVSIASANANITFNVSGNLVGAISSTSTAFPVRNDTGNVTQAMYYNASTSEVTYGPGLAAFGGFQAPLNNSAITAAMVGDWIQAQGNVTLPDVSTIPAGTVFFITSLASDSTPTTLAVNNTGADFIYYPPYYSTTTRSITLYRGQWVQIISRGAGEWNIIATNISAPQKISAYLANNVELSLDIMNFRYDGTNAQFSPVTGSFTVAGQTLQIYPGSAPSSNSFTSGTYTAGTWYNLTGTSLTVAGSTAEAFLYATDGTYRRAYRATFLIVSSGNVYISIERLVG